MSSGDGSAGTHRVGRRRLLAALGLAATGVSSRAGTDMSNDPPREHRIGRFQFTLGSTLLPRGRYQSIYGVEVSTVAAAPGQATLLWAERLAALRSGPKPPGAAERILRGFELLPAVPAVLYHETPDNPGLVTLLAGKPFGDHLLLVARSADVAAAANLEKLVRGVVLGYRPAGQQGFDVGFGTLTSEPGVNEEARLTLTHAALPEFDIRFDSHNVREPERADPLQDFEQDRQRLAGGVALSLLRNQPRRAAGLEGREGWVQFAYKTGENSLRLSWSYPGVAGQATTPAIMIVATARQQDRPALAAAWDMMLGSMRPIPPAPRP